MTADLSSGNGDQINDSQPKTFTLNIYRKSLLTCASVSIIVKLLLCLICKLTFTIGMYRKNNRVYRGVNATCGFKHSLGVLECVPEIRRDYCPTFCLLLHQLINI